jgi:hypothetical protein
VYARSRKIEADILGSIEEHIEELEWKIEQDRKRAKKLRWWGKGLRTPLPIVIFIVGILAAFSVLVAGGQNDPFLGRGMAHLDKVMGNSHPMFWNFLYLIGPPMMTAQGAHKGFFVWLGGWMLLIVGVVWLGDKAVVKADKLDARAERYDDILTAQKPTWISLETLVQMQGLQGGSGNVTQIIQQINKMIHQPEMDKNWYALPVGVVILGVISTTLAAAITKLLGLT